MGSIISKIYHRRDRKVLFLGLSNTYKTSTLSTLQRLYKKPPHTFLTTPTIGFNTECISINHRHLVIWDLGGDANVRSYWKCYFTNVKGVVFFFDAEREVETSLSELQAVKDDPELKSSVFMVVLVKNTQNVREEAIQRIKNTLVGKRAGIFICRMQDEQSVKEAFLWLTNQI